MLTEDIAQPTLTAPVRTAIQETSQQIAERMLVTTIQQPTHNQETLIDRYGVYHRSKTLQKYFRRHGLVPRLHEYIGTDASTLRLVQSIFTKSLQCLKRPCTWLVTERDFVQSKLNESIYTPRWHEIAIDLNAYNQRLNVVTSQRTARSVREFCKRAQLFVSMENTDTTAMEQWVEAGLRTTLIAHSWPAIWQAVQQRMEVLQITEPKARRAHYH